ncbi:MAG TPA: hypothetical protein VHE30_18205 [Polyangiaceae bacterium]|nr:hypothetical protein [Polyangiaceae bacterium]
MSVRFGETLAALVRHEVDFIVVGMAAGVLRGAPVTTVDIDVVHRRTPENVTRLLAALGELHAVYRGDPRRLVPTESHLLGPGHQLLTTVNGDLDCLGAIDGGKSYEDLRAAASELDVGATHPVCVLELPALIEIKRRAGRPKDLAVIPILEATLDEVLRGSSSGGGSGA